MNSEITIRPLKIVDARSFIRCYQDRSKESRIRFDPFPFKLELLAPLTLYLALSNKIGPLFNHLRPQLRFLTLVAVGPDDEVVGFAYLRWKTRTKAHLGIMIGDEYQGEGVGTHLMTRLLQDAKSLSLETIYLTVLKENKPAIALYDRFEFTEIDCPSSTVGQKAIQMRRFLNEES